MALRVEFAGNGFRDVRQRGFGMHFASETIGIKDDANDDDNGRPEANQQFPFHGLPSQSDEPGPGRRPGAKHINQNSGNPV